MSLHFHRPVTREMTRVVCVQASSELLIGSSPRAWLEEREMPSGKLQRR